MQNNTALVSDRAVADIVRVIGLEAYLALVREYGGSTLYIPTAQTSADIMEQWLMKGGMPYAGLGQTARP
jgi:hypothetical protein